MTEYVKSTNFTSKDSLASGNPLKIIKGTEFDIEFNSIATAVVTKADIISAALSGTPTAPTAALGTNTTQLATTAFIAAAIAATKEALYPVGSIYTNAGVTTNPATLLGFGTWTAFGAGRVMVGLNGADALFDALGETGGSKDAIVVSHTHTFSGNTSTAGSHQHVIPHNYDSGTAGDYISGNDGDNNMPGNASPTAFAGAHEHSFSGTTASTGSGATSANLQPYITVAMWKRTA